MVTMLINNTNNYLIVIRENVIQWIIFQRISAMVNKFRCTGIEVFTFKKINKRNV